MAEPSSCPTCGADLPAGALAGLCPRCLLREGLAIAALAAGAPSTLPRPATPEGLAPGRPDSYPTVLPVGVHGAGADTLLTQRFYVGPPRTGSAGRYQLFGEIARGGMGAVHRGRDADLGRDLAVKVLLEAHRDRPELVRRFVEEARISGQLQHPGVVPVYELGAFADRRPYFTMKLVRGRTLASLLDERPDPGQDRPRFLGVFEQVCQTVAYAHAHKVIHRDLKPPSVMVGAFGEVQVMDWGLAKVLGTDGAAPEARDLIGEQTLIQSARSGSGADASRAGSVMGTPASMAPEQARGEIDRVDERADVFALGAILCEILTGRPPHVGPTHAEVLRLASGGDVSDALRRLASSGADAPLLALARRCLAPDPADRPRDAGEVARDLTAYLAGVQERLRAAELARVEAQTRAEEERKRRRAELRLSAGLLAVLVAGTAGVAWQWNRAERHLAGVREANFRLVGANAVTARARDQALTRLNLAIEAVETFTTGVSEDFLLREPSHKALRASLLGSALGYYRKLQAAVEADSDGSPAELAAAYERVARLSHALGSSKDALLVLEQAAAIRERVARERPGGRANRLELALDRNAIGSILLDLSRAAEAGPPLEKALAGLEGLLRERDDPKVRLTLAQAENTLGTIRCGSGRVRDGVRNYERSASLLERLSSDAPDEPAARYHLAEALMNLAEEALHAGRPADAVARFEGAERALDALLRLRPRDLKVRRTAALARNKFADLLQRLGRPDDARRRHERSLASFKELVAEQPNVSDFRHQLAMTYLRQAIVRYESGRAAEALAAAREALPISQRLAAENPETTDYPNGLAKVQMTMGDALLSLDRPAEAAPLVEGALATREKLLRANPENRVIRGEIALGHLILGAIDYETRRPAESLRQYRLAAESYANFVDGPALFNLACVEARIAELLQSSRPARDAEAARHADQAVAALRRARDAGFRNPLAYLTPEFKTLRARPDFQLLLDDATFPDDPFAR